MRTISRIISAAEPESRLRFHSTIIPVHLDSNRIVILAGTQPLRLQAEPKIRRLFELLQVGIPEDRIIGTLIECGFTADSGPALLRQLADRNLLFEDREELVKSISQRYARQLDSFAQHETDAVSRVDYQKGLSSARIAQIGVGGLGTWIALALAPTGIGKLTLIDGDIVELTNLNRQILYTASEIGERKVDAAQHALSSINPEIHVDGVASYISSFNEAKQIIPDCDLVIVSADEPFLRLRDWITDACHERNIPHLFVAAGGVGPLVVPGGGGSCWRCMRLRAEKALPELDNVISVATSAERIKHPQPIAPGYHALMAGVVAAEVVRFCTGYEEPKSIGAQLTWNSSEATMRRIEAPTQPACANHAG